MITKQKHQNDKKKFLDKIFIFQLDYHMQIKRLERYITLWLKLLLIQQNV